jgi:hypothetical protein
MGKEPTSKVNGDRGNGEAMKTKEDYESEEEEQEGPDVDKTKAVLSDLACMIRRLGRLARRFGNTKQQAEAVASTLRLMSGIEQAGADPDTPVEFSFRATFRLDDNNMIDATIGGLLLPLNMISMQILAPIAGTGLAGLEAMREELEEVEEVVAEANTTYEAFTSRLNQEDLN